ncbi:hypothetical protein NL108_001351 [Boleophthalmus pectinirostris]|uniref:metalloreductase STEAP4-like isoform X1 n=1 Tax=Boleophthalmus pectinirostris TaxID=150288 RepID=UPI002432A018|nr:metalloreductase STEAP4-like isoform X1 [Boleophthalmus pectinirostris]KAJ0066100.1 hypothetical protein NL108_001351 [Boleophthalmus pectinirostris]
MSSDNMNGELKVLNPECLPLAPMGAGGGAAGETLCIFGTGDLGRSLGQRLVQSGYRVTYGSRRPDNCGLIPQGAQVMNHAAAAQSARIIFLCIHREHYSFLQTLAPQLSGKVLVDVSNNPEKDMFPEANAVYLQRLLPEASVVKALNTLSAWGLQNGPSDANRQTFICGDSAEAKQAVSEVCTRLGLWVVDRGGVGASQELEDFPLQLFPEWRLPLSIAVGLSAVFFIYLLIRDIIYSYVEDGKDTSFRIMVSLANKVFPIVSLIMLSLCYLPGVMAALLQLHRGTKYRRFPDWLDRWMLCRKQMGLVALGLASLHVLYTLIIGFRYYVRYRVGAGIISQVLKNQTTEFSNILAWRTDSYYSVGILGFALFIVLGITSLPSVSNTLSWREFSFIQSKLGYVTLFLCTFHGYLYGWDKFLRLSSYKWYTVPGYLLSLVVPTVVLGLKLLLLLPCVDRRLTRIRRGWEDTPQDSSERKLLI